MKIAVVSAVYPPEPVVSAAIAWDLANSIGHKGHNVTVVCPHPSRPLGIDYGKRKRIDIQTENGVQIVRLPSFVAPSSGIVGRAIESWSFGRYSRVFLERQAERPDVVYGNTWPLLGQRELARYTQQNHVPLVLHIQDVYPESLLGKVPAFARGVIEPPLLRLDRLTVRKAASIVVLSESVRRLYMERRGVPPEKLIVCPNWQDESRFAQVDTREKACLRYGVDPAPFTFFFLGNIGPVARVDVLIRAFQQSKLSRAQLVIAGDGTEKERCSNLARDMGLRNVTFISDPDVQNVGILHQIAHVCLLPMRQGSAASSIPSKLPAYLFSGRPILATVDQGSEAARCIETARCGWVGPADDVSWLADRMRVAAALSVHELQAVGERGRLYGLTNFSRKPGVSRLSDVVIEAGRKVGVPAL